MYNPQDYAPLAQLLEARGMAVEVAGINRIDWSRNAAALTDGNWWRGTLKPRPAVDWWVGGSRRAAMWHKWKRCG